jgi:hypothetical protein
MRLRPGAWIMDRGIPTEAVLAEMRASDPPLQYLVGTPKGRLSRLEKDLLTKPRQQARDGVKVKLLADDAELYVFAESADRVTKERVIRRRQMKWISKRLRELVAMEVSHEEKIHPARPRLPTADPATQAAVATSAAAENHRSRTRSRRQCTGDGVRAK